MKVGIYEQDICGKFNVYFWKCLDCDKQSKIFSTMAEARNAAKKHTHKKD